MPAIVIPLAMAIVVKDLRPGVLIAAGAFSVGFGGFHDLGGSRLHPMLVAASGMCLSSWLGTLAGSSTPASIAVVVAAAYVYGLVSLRGPTASWIALQCLVWLIISTAYPAADIHILFRGFLILTGGLFQIALLFLFWRILGAAPPLQAQPQTPQAEGTHAQLYAIRVMVTLAAAAVLYRSLGANMNAYWIPMTAIIIIRPGLEEALQRGLARMVGTLVGAIVATVIAQIAYPSPYASAFLVLLFAWVCYSVIWMNYALFAMSLTSYVVFLLSLAGLSQKALILHRVAFTLAGGAISFIGHVTFSRVFRASR